MHLAARWAAARAVPLHVACVDHGLRPESAAEAAGVRTAATRLGLPASVLRWQGWAGRGNLQAAAREGRAALLADWARQTGLTAIALGHTRDDQAETVLLRLARGSGVDGLAGMAARSTRLGTLWLRPLLDLDRAALRDWLAARGIGWFDDPSNADSRFDRVRARAALAALAPLGIDAKGLAATAARLADARTVLEDAARRLAADALTVDCCGAIHLRLAPMRDARPETVLRLLGAALATVAGAPYPPRRAALESLWAGQGQPRTSLHGCLVGRRRGSLWIAREPAAVAPGAAPLEDRPAAFGGGDPAAPLWNNRWRLTTTAEGRVAAVGAAGLAALRTAQAAGTWEPPEAWTDSPRPARLTTPALWRDDRLACAPAAAYGDGLKAEWHGLPPWLTEPR